MEKYITLNNYNVKLKNFYNLSLIEQRELLLNIFFEWRSWILNNNKPDWLYQECKDLCRNIEVLPETAINIDHIIAVNNEVIDLKDKLASYFLGIGDAWKLTREHLEAAALTEYKWKRRFK